jgi:hypothetical protein
MAIVVSTCGVVTVGPAHAQQRDGGLLPGEERGLITVAGCFVRGVQVRGGENDTYVLSRPIRGPVNSVPESACTADPDGDALDLEKTSQAGMNDSMLGHWIEVSGELEKETTSNPDNLRELDVRSFRMVPVVPRPAAAASAPQPPIPQQPIAPAPQRTAPVGTTGEAPQSLPRTASHIPAIGLFGLLSVAGGLVLRSFRFHDPA